MKEFVLSCCSTADLKEEHFRSRDISYLCFSYWLNGVEHKDDLGKTMPFEEFYKAMEGGAETKTSLINTGEYIEYFTPFLEAGRDILHISFSGGISGSANSAKLAKEELAKKYPDRKLYVIDSLCASSGYGLLMDKLADLRDEGKDIDELYAWTEDNKLRVRHLFFSSVLTYYIRGGRISKTAGLVGTILNICPLMEMDKEGRLALKSKAIGKKSAIKKTVNRMEELADDGLSYGEKCYICHSACYDDAKMIQELIEDHFPRVKGEVLINDIGTTIGSHTGPGTISVFFFGKPRTE